MWWKYLLGTGMAVMIVFSFTTPAPQQVIGESSRIFYYHIPQAWLCVAAFAVAAWYSIQYLRTRDLHSDDKAAASAGLGFVFCALATLSGSIFAKVTWGSFWNWDPRETSIFLLLLIYGAYFALRQAIEVDDRRARLAAVYNLLAFLTVPFLIFIMPRILPSLHPSDSIVDENLKFTMGPVVRTIFFSSLILFSMLFIWMLRLSFRVQKLVRIRMERE